MDAWLGHSAVILGVAFALDATWGEPPNALHPVVWMGRAIAPLKRCAGARPLVALLIGTLYALLVAFGFAALFWAVEAGLSAQPVLRAAFVVYGLFGCFALKGLVAAGDQVRKALAASDLVQARVGLSSLCSRDAQDLSASEVAGASIESLTENLSDSVVAPLFFFVLFGLPGAVFYRAANTMDAMVGYRGRFEYVGKAAARLDDLLNLVPARLSALLLLCAGACTGQDVRRGFAIWLRDKSRTESPNAGHPMAMGAGLLGVRLDKRAVYTLGAELAEPDASAVARAQTLTRVAGIWAWLCALFSLVWLSGRHVFSF